MFRSVKSAATCIVAVTLALGVGTADARAGTITGFTVKLNGDPNPDVTVSVVGGGTTLSGPDGSFSVATPNIRPVSATFSKADLTVTVTNLDGFATHNISVVVPDVTEMAAPCPIPVWHEPCYRGKPARRFFRRR